MVELEPSRSVNDLQVIALSTAVLNPMGYIDAGQELAQSLSVGECVLGLGVMVKVEEGEAIDN